MREHSNRREFKTGETVSWDVSKVGRKRGDNSWAHFQTGKRYQQLLQEHPATHTQRRCVSFPCNTTAASSTNLHPVIHCYAFLFVLSNFYPPPLWTMGICCLGQDTKTQLPFHLHKLLNTLRRLKKKALKGKNFLLPLLYNSIGSSKFSDSNYSCIFPIWHLTVTDGNVKNK